MNPRTRKRINKKSREAWQPLVRAVGKNGKHEAMFAGETFRIFKNNRYTVMVREIEGHGEWPEMVHLSIRRNDRAAIFDWRDVQRIKNEMVGKEAEGVQLFPAESRLVDTANQYHIYVLKDETVMFPFGYGERLISESGSFGAAQRPFEEPPDDCKSDEEIDRLHDEYIKSSTIV